VLPPGFRRVDIGIRGCLTGDLNEFEVSRNRGRLVADGGTCNVGITIYHNYVNGPAEQNVVQGNFIGTGPGGANPLPNGGAGIDILAWATGNVIGGALAGQGNTIAHNGGDGVRVSGPDAVGNTIQGNSIHSNGGKGIELVDGGNTELAPPVITSVNPVSGTACANCTVDIYSDDDGEGRVHEGFTTAGPDGAFTWLGTPSGPNVTATATNASHNTSEFSAPIPFLNGDVNCDKGVTAVDCLYILQNVVGTRFCSLVCPLVPGSLYCPAADTQCDTDIDAVDALFCLQYVVGARPSLQCSQ
jgi:parallel beta-helix repeat protein